jgi:eukaryotic-like serine/threonine-protein kinase
MPTTPLLNNRYQLESSIGSGGMAVVYRARDLMLERSVAVKVLREDFSSDPSFRDRFRQEARAAANLYHPNIVTIHDFGLDAGRLFIVMEMVPGTDLKSITQKRGRLSVEEAVNIMVQACAGIGYAHRAGLVHCDIKPHNMLVTPDQRLKVADFGIARALASIRPDEKINVVWGSPQYFSPEQAAGGAPSPASDVYSLGVVMYELLTGQLPFIAATATELAQMHRQAAPPPPRQFNPAIPPALEQVLLKVLSKEPSARYRTADQLGRVLLTIQGANPAVSGTGPFRPVSTASPATADSPSRPAAIYRPPNAQASQPIQTSRPVKVAQGTPEQAEPEDNPLAIDWGTLALGLLTLLAVGGLIPFWIWVYFVYNPPFR